MRYVTVAVVLTLIALIAIFALTEIWAVRKKKREQEAHEEARRTAKWELETEVFDGKLFVGVAKKARHGKWAERVQSEPPEEVPINDPEFQIKAEILKQKARDRAFTLNLIDA